MLRVLESFKFTSSSSTARDAGVEENTVNYNDPKNMDFLTRMRQEIEPNGCSQFNDYNVPEFLYLIVDEEEWYASTKLFPAHSAAARKGHRVVELCDVDRIDALAARKFFRAEYEEAIQGMNSISSRLSRSVSEFLKRSIGGKRASAATARRGGGSGTTMPAVNPYSPNPYRPTLDIRMNGTHTGHYKVSKTHFLVIVDAESLVHTSSLHWDSTPYHYPYIDRPLNKSSDICIKVPLCYDTKTLKVPLPTRRELAYKVESYKLSQR